VVDNDIKNGEQNEEVLSQKNMVQALGVLSTCYPTMRAGR
jgi:hypothetical protein